VSPDSELATLSDDDLRDQLRAARHEEADVSYERRLLHGKIDVLRSEVRARIDRGEAGKDAGGEALESLLARLTDVLVHKGPPPIEAELAELGVGDEDAAPSPQVPPAEELPAFETLSDDELRGLVRALVQREQEVSARRRELHGVLDRLRGEHVIRLQRRYAGDAGDTGDE
jgi:hypothetical protein